jgi:hypothetical protein
LHIFIQDYKRQIIQYNGLQKCTFTGYVIQFKAMEKSLKTVNLKLHLCTGIFNMLRTDIQFWGFPKLLGKVIIHKV